MPREALEGIMETIYKMSPKGSLAGRLRSTLSLEFVKKDLQQVNRYLKTKNVLILDLGCQTGYITAYLSSKGFAVIGLDPSSSRWQTRLWKKLASRFKVSFIVGDGKCLPLKDRIFGAVICYAVIEHIPDNDSVLAECNRVLDEKGLFFIFGLPKRRSYTERLARTLGLWHHENLYDKGEIGNLLKRHGFQVEELKDVNVLPGSVELWNIAYLWLLLFYIERLLVKTPLKLISHSLTVVSRKRF